MKELSLLLGIAAGLVSFSPMTYANVAAPSCIQEQKISLGGPIIESLQTDCQGMVVQSQKFSCDMYATVGGLLNARKNGETSKVLASYTYTTTQKFYVVTENLCTHQVQKEKGQIIAEHHSVSLSFSGTDDCREKGAMDEALKACNQDRAVKLNILNANRE